MVRNLTFTVDYFNIRSTTPSRHRHAQHPEWLLRGWVDEYCGLVVRNNVGRIAYVNDFYANIGTIRTGGIDFAIRTCCPPTSAGSPSASMAAGSPSTTSPSS